MPNNVTNRITVIGTKEQIKEVFEKFNTHIPAHLNRAHDNSIICRKKEKTEGFNVGWFDEKTGQFTERVVKGNDVIHTGLPDGWEFDINIAVDQFPDFNKVIPQPDNIFNGNLGAEEKAMCKREGRPDWYSWNIDNWGSKWGGYSYKRIDDNVFEFETAWSSAPKILEEMSKQFPDVHFSYEYADEDVSYNCGVMGFERGELLSSRIPEGGSKEAHDLVFRLRPEYKEYYKLVDGEYISVDENEED